MAEGLKFHSRRATVEDLPMLRGLWRTAMLPSQDLERFLTEVQLVEGLDGRLMGALGFQILGKDARIYDEAYTHPDTEALVKPQLWNRLKVVAANRGVHRIWTQEKSPYWAECGFASVTADDYERLPKAFQHALGNWRVLALRDEATERLIEQELEFFQAAHEEDKFRWMLRFKVVKWITVLITTIFCGVLLYYAHRLLFDYYMVRFWLNLLQ
ncbi:MAG: hypothetical protein M2R45_04268 [Verrucomicrobia subdivision 3 bacterium]|nr:hypothetical protein [Limisphaerales bacterium]MCS1417375.1 hypothetical protein [Limisphaerales bacterium]